MTISHQDTTLLTRSFLKSQTQDEARLKLGILPGGPGGTVPLGGVAGYQLVSDGTPGGSMWVEDEGRKIKYASALMLGGM